MKQILAVIGCVAMVLVAITVWASDIPQEVVSSPDGGSFCTTNLYAQRQLAIQCDGGVYARTCKSTGSGCTAAAATDVHVDTNAVYDLVMPGQHDRICVIPDTRSPASCKVFMVDPQQLKTGAP